LSDAVGNAILDFTYDDTGTGWHPATDGLGFSLAIVDENAPAASWNDGASWRPSTAIGGSPGAADNGIVGDLTGDGRVGTADLAVLQGHLGITSGATAAMGDLSGDGAVNRADVAIFVRQYGLGAAAGASPAVVAAPAAVVVAREASLAGDDGLSAGGRRRVAARSVDRAARDRAIVDVADSIDARIGSELTTARRSTLARRLHRATADSRRS
jgi:hypothetical protein